MIAEDKLAPRRGCQDDVAKMVKDFLDDGRYGPQEWSALIELAAQAMSTLIWRHGEQLEVQGVQLDIEDLIEFCEQRARYILKQRFDHWQAKVFADEAQDQAAH